MSTANSDSHGHENSHLAHHFKTMDQQFDAAKMGIWLFLCTEVLMFGGLFVGYIIFHGVFPEMFAEGARQLNWRMGALNTVVLLASSYTMAMGIHYAQTNNPKKSFNMLAITFICGLIFMCIKAYEYSLKFEHGFLPGHFFRAHEFEHANLAMYFSFYFLMTGLHGAHVMIGMGLIAWMMIRTKRGDFSNEFYTPVEGVGLFWHLVDLIWIYLFPLLYLVG
jgi:cytochrome c oxidase subunit 3